MYSQNFFLSDERNSIWLKLLLSGHCCLDERYQTDLSGRLFSTLYYVRRGSLTLTLPSGETHALLPNRWYLLPMNLTGSLKCNGEYEGLYFHIQLLDTDQRELLFDCCRLYSMAQRAEDSQMLSYVFANITKWNLLVGMEIKGFLYQIVAKILGENNILCQFHCFSDVVQHARKYIHDNLSIKLTAQELAQALSVSRRTLEEHFKKEVSMSISEYILHEVLGKATILLMAKDIPVAAIGAELGYEDQFYFSRRFKQKYGISPLQYRKRHKNSLSTGL